MGFENVGLIWTPESFSQYLATVSKPDWCKAITFHHTASPSLAQRPRGLLIQHVENLCHFYKDEKHWSAGPHLFIDDDQIFGMCDLRRKGVHAVSFNSFAIGIEVLGDYDAEDPRKGRGLQCWTTAAGAAGALLDWLGLAADDEAVLFHRDDPTTKKTCPGKKIDKGWLLDLIASSTTVRQPTAETEKPDVGIEWNEWDFCGERWCVPVLKFLVAKGIPSKTVIANLKSVGGLFFYGQELLEGAHYVGQNSPLKPNQCTWAPARELMELV